MLDGKLEAIGYVAAEGGVTSHVVNVVSMVRLFRYGGLQPVKSGAYYASNTSLRLKPEAPLGRFGLMQYVLQEPIHTHTYVLLGILARL